MAADGGPGGAQSWGLLNREAQRADYATATGKCQAALEPSGWREVTAHYERKDGVAWDMNHAKVPVQKHQVT